MEIDHDGKYGMLEQYESIIDENPTIKQFCL
jgi:hypothetical protein